MTNYYIRRVLLIVPQLLILSVLIFGITRLAPGDVAITRMGMEASEEQLELLREELGLNEPLVVQYGMWLREITSLRFGRSFISGEPVAALISTRLGPTALLSFSALVVSVLLGILLGSAAAWKRNTLLDHVVTITSFFFVSVPSFWSAIMAIILFAIVLGWLPAVGMNTAGREPSLLDTLQHLILPASILALDGMASVARYTRSGLIEVSLEDYMRTARAKGLTEPMVMRRHALKNALLPVVTIIGLRLPQLVGGSVLVETVFSWPGLGTAAVEAARQRDYPVTMALVMVVGFATVVANLLADLLYGLLDPRIRQ